MRSYDLITIQYEDFMPVENEGYKESYKREQETIARIQDMKFKALCKGYDLKLRASAKDLDKTFIQPELPKRKGDPAYTLSELKQMNEAYKTRV